MVWWRSVTCVQCFKLIFKGLVSTFPGGEHPSDGRSGSLRLLMLQSQSQDMTRSATFCMIFTFRDLHHILNSVFQSIIPLRLLGFKHICFGHAVILLMSFSLFLNSFSKSTIFCNLRFWNVELSCTAALRTHPLTAAHIKVLSAMPSLLRAINSETWICICLKNSSHCGNVVISPSAISSLNCTVAKG